MKGGNGGGAEKGEAVQFQTTWGGGILEGRESRGETLLESDTTLIQAQSKHDVCRRMCVFWLFRKSFVSQKSGVIEWHLKFEYKRGVINERGGIKAIEDSYNHTLLLRDCSWGESSEQFVRPDWLCSRCSGPFAAHG